ncbi:30S ribosomal protein S12 methylthiotransferase RimO [Candidatus Caldatribacterium sp. SIUC1]|uniref:30S ribosomal protein S12 methylthiotransferase RimO n=1 Tax=Candidatus Caldatribacterium sp. SIUC1 TaxID=3418365 RepID=UPI003F68DA0D
MKRIAFVTLGCDKNLVDSEVVLGKLLVHGYNAVVPPEEAEWVFLNTCAFIRPSCEEAEAWIRRLIRLKKKDPRKKIVVLGCYVERFRERAASRYREVDFWVGVHEIFRLPDIISSGKRGVFLGSSPSIYTHTDPRILSTPPHYAYLKIAEGCLHRCSFCLIPALRGPLRSRPISSVVEEARLLEKAGVREIVLVAQDLTSYGLDLYRQRSLGRLLQALGEALQEDTWIRLLYLSPEGIDDTVIEAVASIPQVVKYLDIPLQHVVPDILQRMRRFSSFEEIRRRLEKIRDRIPGVALRTTFMVGFPGEGEEHFLRLLDFVQAFRFERMGAFMYSDEEGTLSFALEPKVPEEVKERRYAALMEAQRDVMESVHRTYRGMAFEVLLDEGPLWSEQGPFFLGRTAKDAPEVDCRVKVWTRGVNLRRGQRVAVRITTTSAYELEGEVL